MMTWRELRTFSIKIATNFQVICIILILQIRIYKYTYRVYFIFHCFWHDIHQFVSQEPKTNRKTEPYHRVVGGNNGVINLISARVGKNYISHNLQRCSLPIENDKKQSENRV